MTITNSNDGTFTRTEECPVCGEIYRDVVVPVGDSACEVIEVLTDDCGH